MPLQTDKHNGSSGDFSHRMKKHSTTESLYSRHDHKKHKSEPDDTLKGSWIYALCMRCNVQCMYLIRSCPNVMSYSVKIF